MTHLIDEVDEFENVMSTAIKAIYKFINNEPLDTLFAEI